MASRSARYFLCPIYSSRNDLFFIGPNKVGLVGALAGHKPNPYDNSLKTLYLSTEESAISLRDLNLFPRVSLISPTDTLAGL